MLETIDLTKKLDKTEYKQAMPILREQLYQIQKTSWDAGIPVVIIFEGWDAAGKGTSIQTLTGSLDPRGFKLYPIRAVRTYEKKRPWLWRFWTKLPARGEWAIFDRSWYGRVLVERVEDLVPENEWRRAYRDILDFERTIADDGYFIIKFFLHISKSEQKQRFEKLEKDPLEAWHVAPEDWEHHRRYDEWLLAYEEMLERSESEWGPWTIVEGTDRRFTHAKIYKTIITALQERLKIIPADSPAETAHPSLVNVSPTPVLPPSETPVPAPEVNASTSITEVNEIEQPNPKADKISKSSRKVKNQPKE